MKIAVIIHSLSALNPLTSSSQIIRLLNKMPEYFIQRRSQNCVELLPTVRNYKNQKMPHSISLFFDNFFKNISIEEIYSFNAFSYVIEKKVGRGGIKSPLGGKDPCWREGG